MIETGSNQAGSELVLLRTLQGYQLAKEQASRCNRNLLQYGAAIATILGISAGSGSIFALAESVGQTEGTGGLPSWAVGMLVGELMIVGLLMLVLLTVLYRTFSKRDQAEREADNYLSTLIALGPDRYWPKDTT
jgi:hypothetical protein